MRCALVSQSRELVVAAGFLGGLSALSAPRPRSLRLKEAPLRKGRGAHVVLDPPLACLPADLGHLSHVPLDAGGLIRVSARLILARSFEVVQVGEYMNLV